MVNWNPSFPEVLGNEWLADIGTYGRVWAGAPAHMFRKDSTVVETINSLKLSATVNPSLEASVPTLIDIIEAGNEAPAAFTAVNLNPDSDVVDGGWVLDTGSNVNLFTGINENPMLWPGPAQDSWIQTTDPTDVATFSVGAAQFAVGGAQQNARIGYVHVRAILGTNRGWRKMSVNLDLGGTIYQPAGGGTRDVHEYGAMFDFRFGEINPATGLPWTPANIANFGSAGTYRLRVRSGLAATVDQFPRVYALALRVWYLTVENRAAVAVWRRPEELTSRLTNITTDWLMTMPSGAANWSKLSSRNYIFYWRQAVAPSQYGPVVADDVRWNLVRSNLGPAGQPPGWGAAPGGVMESDAQAHDQFGRPGRLFAASALHSVHGLCMVRTDLAISADSQPYRLDTSDLVTVSSTQKVGQRVTPGSAQTYLGVRFPIIPPASGNPTLTAAIHRVSDGVQIGGTFTITGDAARALPAGPGGWRYVTGFLSSGAALASATAYEIRLTTTAAGTWTVAMPDSSLGASASFGGTTDGAFIGATHFTDRDLSINVTRQPDAPTAFAAATTNIAATSFAGDATTFPAAALTWTLPAVGMGSAFSRYEIERSIASGPWQRIANVRTSSVAALTVYDVPRGKSTQWRIRAVGTDGRFSNWATSNTLTITETRPSLLLVSDHAQALSFFHLYELTSSADAETIYPILGTEHDEVVALHQRDYQIVFSEAEDRGTGWHTRVSLRQNVAGGAVGAARFDGLKALVRSSAIPYVCAIDHQGNYLLGHVSLSDPIQTQPAYQYTAQLDIIPTHTEPVPIEVT
jgi:hypothetical protein